MAIAKTLGNNWYHVLGVAFLICALTLVGGVSCQQAEEGSCRKTEGGPTLEEGKVAFEGTVKVALGKYMFVPEAQGFDIVVDGTVDGGDLASLIGKEVKGEGEFPPEDPWLLFATSLEVKDEGGSFRNVFTGTGGIGRRPRSPHFAGTEMNMYCRKTWPTTRTMFGKGSKKLK